MLESDSLHAIKTVKGMVDSFALDGHIVYDIKHLISLTSTFHGIYCLHKANNAAHTLVKFSLYV